MVHTCLVFVRSLAARLAARPSQVQTYGVGELAPAIEPLLQTKESLVVGFSRRDHVGALAAEVLC